MKNLKKSLLIIIPIIGPMILLYLFSVKSNKIKYFKYLLISVFINIVFFNIIVNYSKENNNNKKGLLTKDVIGYIDNALIAYKVRKGSFPKTLKELENIKAFVIINDPFKVSFFEDNKSNNEFNYKSFDTCYLLFSVGPDLIPHTSDDIISDNSCKLQ